MYTHSRQLLIIIIRNSVVLSKWPNCMV